MDESVIFPLNEDVLTKILNFLSIAHYPVICTVNKSFYHIATSDPTWIGYFKEVYGHETPQKLDPAFSSWREYYRDYLRYTFDTTFDTGNLIYGGKWTCKKKSHSPDMSFAVGACGFSEKDGIVGWNIKIGGFSDELRVGFTDEYKHKYSVYTTSDPRMWIWSDGNRRHIQGWHSGGGFKRSLPGYTSGNTLGFVLDFRRKKVGLFQNNTFVAAVDLPPSQYLWPIVCLDSKDDFVSISKMKEIPDFE